MPSRSSRSTTPSRSQCISIRGETYDRLAAEAQRLGLPGPSALAQQWIEESPAMDAPFVERPAPPPKPRAKAKAKVEAEIHAYVEF